MAKQTFTTGQVLTAAQMTSLQQTAMGGGSTTAKTTSYVLTAADAGTVVAMNAAGATTITVNTGLFSAGDTVFIQNWGAGTCTVTAGTATVTTHGSLALGQWEGGTLYFTSTSAAIFFDISQTSGMTNPMTTTGDTIYSSSGSTPARLGIGSTGQVLTVAGGIPSWATPASGGGMTLLSTTTLSAASTTISFTPTGYVDLAIRCSGIDTSSDDTLRIRLNSDSGNNYINLLGYKQGSGAAGFDASFDGGNYIPRSDLSIGNNSGSNFAVDIKNCNDTSNILYQFYGVTQNTGNSYYSVWGTGRYAASAAISSVTVYSGSSGSMTGTVRIYGVK